MYTSAGNEFLPDFFKFKQKGNVMNLVQGETFFFRVGYGKPIKEMARDADISICAGITDEDDPDYEIERVVLLETALFHPEDKTDTAISSKWVEEEASIMKAGWGLPLIEHLIFLPAADVLPDEDGTSAIVALGAIIDENTRVCLFKNGSGRRKLRTVISQNAQNEREGRQFSFLAVRLA
jgi:hypothetical protein